MHPTTLRGVFPEPKQPYKKNFIRENVKSIRQLQGMLRQAGIFEARSVPVKTSTDQAANKNRSHSTDPPTNKKQQQPPTKKTKVKCLDRATQKESKFDKPLVRLKKKALMRGSGALGASGYEEAEPKYTHRSIQTEKCDEMAKLYETGVIKYASKKMPVAPPMAAAKSFVSPKKGADKEGAAGDAMDSSGDAKAPPAATGDDKDFIKENIKSLKSKVGVNKTQSMPGKVPAKPPVTYQRGALPKYLKDRKKDEFEEGEAEPDCPPGHVLLPEDERKETLRVLRQSYADRIQELNSMPVRNDTLRMRRRKMEIEEELKRIDGGIKVFQRPKVFVKINA